MYLKLRTQTTVLDTLTTELLAPTRIHVHMHSYTMQSYSAMYMYMYMMADH